MTNSYFLTQNSYSLAGIWESAHKKKGLKHCKTFLVPMPLLHKKQVLLPKMLAAMLLTLLRGREEISFPILMRCMYVYKNLQRL